MLHHGAEDVAHVNHWSEPGIPISHAENKQKSSAWLSRSRRKMKTQDRRTCGMGCGCLQYTATGAVDLRVPPVKPVSTPKRKHLILTVSLGGQDDTGCPFSYTGVMVLF